VCCVLCGGVCGGGSGEGGDDDGDAWCMVVVVDGGGLW
jgi:hypothetical protein